MDSVCHRFGRKNLILWREIFSVFVFFSSPYFWQQSALKSLQLFGSGNRGLTSGSLAVGSDLSYLGSFCDFSSLIDFIRTVSHYLFVVFRL